MIATMATSQSVPNELSDFTTDTGLCDVTYKKDIQIKYLETSLRLIFRNLIQLNSRRFGRDVAYRHQLEAS